MLVDPSAYTQSMADRLKASLEKQGVLVTQVPIIEGQASYTAQVNQALANNPTGVYVSTYFPQGGGAYNGGGGNYNNPPGAPQPTSPVKRFENWNYCHTHGGDVDDNDREDDDGSDARSPYPP